MRGYHSMECLTSCIIRALLHTSSQLTIFLVWLKSYVSLVQKNQVSRDTLSASRVWVNFWQKLILLVSFAHRNLLVCKIYPNSNLSPHSNAMEGSKWIRIQPWWKQKSTSTRKVFLSLERPPFNFTIYQIVTL